MDLSLFVWHGTQQEHIALAMVVAVQVKDYRDLLH
jgi:hypothetical protein